MLKFSLFYHNFKNKTYNNWRRLISMVDLLYQKCLIYKNDIEIDAGVADIEYLTFDHPYVLLNIKNKNNLDFINFFRAIYVDLKIFQLHNYGAIDYKYIRIIRTDNNLNMTPCAAPIVIITPLK